LEWGQASADWIVAALIVFGWQAASVPTLRSLFHPTSHIQSKSELAIRFKIKLSIEPQRKICQKSERCKILGDISEHVQISQITADF
jgi:hypothetical protein